MATDHFGYHKKPTLNNITAQNPNFSPNALHIIRLNHPNVVFVNLLKSGSLDSIN